MRKIIRLTENNIRQIVRESVGRIINEMYSDSEITLSRKQSELKRKVIDFLEKRGYHKWGNLYDDNGNMLAVSINDYTDCNKIYNMLKRMFKDNWYLNVRYDSNLVGKDERAIIYLPSVTHLNGDI